jgi:hypothetical protein
MKYNDYIEKVAELMDIAKSDAIQQAKVAWDSGALDTTAFGNDYILPKIFIAAYSSRMKFQFSPLTKEYLKEVKNLEHFI